MPPMSVLQCHRNIEVNPFNQAMGIEFAMRTKWMLAVVFFSL